MRLIFTIVFLSVTFFLQAQQNILYTMMHDDIERTYFVYVPESYAEDTPAPLVFNFHGFGSNAVEQDFYTDMRGVADTAGFLLVHPQGTLYNGVTQHWNVGGFTQGSTVDDIGFTSAMIDSIAAEYSVDLDRVYSTGMSNGGFMSYLLACQLGDRIAAIASVTGSMTPETYAECAPTHPTPVMQIHGTLDPTVPYDGNNIAEPIEDVVQYWVDYNNCNPDATVIEVENTNLLDLTTAEHYIYDGGDNGVHTEFFRIEDGTHTWPGAALAFPGTNYDINASIEIWNFFNRYDINGLIDPTTNTTNIELAESIQIYPNPMQDVLQINLIEQHTTDYFLHNSIGQLVNYGTITTANASLDVSALPSGIYYLSVGGTTKKVVK